MEKPWLAHYDQGVPVSITYPRISLFQTLADSARKYPDRPATKLVMRYLGPFAMGGELTYAQLLDQVNRCAAALHALGVRKGDRVALMVPNLPQFVISFYAAARLGAIIVNTNPTYTGREMAQQFADSGAETVILLSPYVQKLREVQAQTAIKRVIFTDVTDYATPLTRLLAQRTLRAHGLLADVPAGEATYRFRPLLDAHPEAPPEVAIDPDEIALFQYTGGTTGVPKAAMLSHYNLVVNTVQVARWLRDLEEGHERVIGAIPFFHVYGMTVAMGLAIYSAAQLIIIPNPRPIDGVMKAIHREHATLFPGVPAMYIGIINHPDVGKYNLRSVKACISGSAPLPMEVQIRFGELTGGRLVEGYGLTEAAPVTHCNPIYGVRKAGSIGIPFPDVEAKVMDYEKFVEKPVGEEGELWVKGPQVMKGYWRRPDETAKTITADGWLRTGDVARMDEDGYFYIVDRLKDMINVGGLKVIPREVEEVLFQHPKVQEAVAVGVPDPVRGETVKAYVVLKPGEAATVEEISRWCSERLAPYKVPRQVEFRSELPKTMVGKVLRRVLAEEERRKQAGA
ncbi:MAG: long-chain-fatty-acid--CoA ligase [Anaerolineae bacterium]